MFTLAVSLLVIAGTILASPPAASSQEPKEPPVPAFYRPPAALPAPGNVIRTEPIPVILSAPAAKGTFPAKATRVLYSSTTQDGAKVAVSGTLLEPSLPWSGKGPRPTVITGPGSGGQGDQCAPSRNITFPMTINVDNPSMGVNTEFLSSHGLLLAGIRVFITDFIGLGTPGIHTYGNRLEQAHAMIDGLRAALKIKRLPTNSPVGFWGYSQSGGAAASAAELVSQYGPELNVRGTFAGSPPANLISTLSSINRNLIVGVSAYAMNGFMARYPELKKVIDRIYNRKAKALLRSLSTSCLPDTILKSAFTDTKTWTKNGKSLDYHVKTEPVVHRILDEQLIGRLKPNAPVMILEGIHDDVVPYGQAYQLSKDWCSQGARVTFVADRTPSLIPRSGANHAVPMLTGVPRGVKYLTDRFNGVPAPQTCRR